ncbi:MAG: hypothetical protein ACQERM_11860 [Methanobacteriota archaeon]
MAEHADQPAQIDRSTDGVEFTYDWYRRFLRRLAAAGYEFRSFGDPLGDRDVVLRHDVDLSLDAAVAMARIEADIGVESTYCVLLSSPLYNPLEGEHRRSLAELESLGHEVIPHVSTHAYWTEGEVPDAAAIEQRVDEEQAVLATVVSPSETVSFHRPPPWVLDREFEGFRNAYAPALFSEIGYVADSNQRWREDSAFVEDLPETLQLLTHPGLWGERDAGFSGRVERAISDACSRAGRATRAEFLDGGAVR